MNILVTGGAGFIGSHITDKYIEAGHRVIIIDSLSNGKTENINPKAIFHQADITNKEELENIFAKEKIDVINHHAAQIDVQKSIENPEYDAQINIIGTLNLLKLAQQYNIKKFIFASSAAVYGNELPPLHEGITPQPISPYGMSKFAAECYVQLLHANHVILRYPNVYGPRQHTKEGGVIARFAEKMKNGEDVTIYGDGTQTRDFVYVKDVAEANLKALTVSTELNIYNIGTEQPTSINKIFQMLKDLTKYNKNPVYEPERTGDIKHSWFDCTNAELLHWRAKTDIKQGLQEIVHAK